MTRSTITGGAIAIALILLALAAVYWVRRQDVDRSAAPSPAIATSTGPIAAEDHQGCLYGRLTTNDGATYEGRLRWGGDEEAFWGDYFSGYKDKNPWVTQVPPEHQKWSRPLKIFGLEIAHWESRIEIGRPFMARFGDIARIEANGRDLWVTLKSGTVFHLDLFDANDFDDGIRVWDDRRRVVDFKEKWIRSIDFLHSGGLGTVSDRLHGTVRTRQGDFTGFVQWNRKECVGSDELDGHTAAGELSLRFNTIRSIARHSLDSARVTLLDGREIVLSDAREVSHDNRGIYVDDGRYGRVLVSWEAFERVDFTPGGGGPAYGDFPPGRPLTGTVTTSAGRRLTGRLVYDLDESETTDTLDAPSQGVNYNIPFGMISSIVFANREERGIQRAQVILNSGEELQLERTGDLGKGNAGMLIFVNGRNRPEYVRWTDVEQVDFDCPPAMYPPLDKR
jgi:hypothetical protein